MDHVIMGSSMSTALDDEITTCTPLVTCDAWMWLGIQRCGNEEPLAGLRERVQSNPVVWQSRPGSVRSGRLRFDWVMEDQLLDPTFGYIALRCSGNRGGRYGW